MLNRTKAMALLAIAALSFAPQLAEAKVRKHVRGHTAVQTMRHQDVSAALIIDADSGKVLYAENASEPRYPASLTKMMTLYMTFDALRSGKLKLTQQMYVSAHAAGMPQTNLALRAGTYLDVETAIRALVVRSANDAAVVLGETLGGSEAGFAQKMTAKAHQLGMNNTTFKNANGLPNKDQKTTARDLAVLALALKKHYPQYYHYFKTTQFAYAGKTYITHNRVLLNYPGCDGLKTGFINASGFNLVTSVHRNEKHLVGVVMGGSSWAARDRRMMDLMDRALGIGAPLQVVKSPTVKASDAKQLAEVSGAKAKAKAEEKTAAGKPDGGPENTGANTADTPQANLDSSKVLATAVDGSREKDDGVQVASLGEDADTVAAAKEVKPQETKPVFAVHWEGQGDAAPAVAPVSTLHGQTLTTARGTPVSTPEVAGIPASHGGWGIQVGAFGSKEDAESAARTVLAQLPELAHAQPMAPQAQSGGAVQRARLGNLNEAEARLACRKLVGQNKPCFVFQVN